MFIGKEAFENVKNNLHREPWRTFYEDVSVLSNKLLETEIQEEDSTTYASILFRTRFFSRAVITLAGFYKISGDKKYAERAWHFICESLEWDKWHDVTSPGDWEFDLSTGELAFTYSLVLSWLDDWLDEEKRSRIISKLNQKVITPYLRSFSNEYFPEEPWWYRNTANWNTVCNGGMLCLALYLSKESEEASKAIPIAMNGLETYINNIHSDGSSEEGVGYWTYATIFLTYALLTYEAATGKQHPAFALPALGEGLMFPFDFSFSSKGSGISFGDVNWFRPTGVLYALAARTNQKSVIRELTIRLLGKSRSIKEKPVFEKETFMRPDEIFSLLCCTEPFEEPDIEKTDLKLFRVYPVNGWGLFKRKRLSLSFRSGSSKVSHGMRDLNSIQLAKDDILLLENKGNHPYTEGWFSPVRGQYFEDQTLSKNSMLVNGIGQVCYGEAAWGNSESSMWSDAASTYPFFVKKALRKVELTEEGFQLTDEFVTESDTWHEIRFITYGEFLEENPGKWIVKRDEASVSLSFSSARELFYSVCDAPSSIGTRPAAKMLRVLTREPSKETKITTVIKE